MDSTDDVSDPGLEPPPLELATSELGEPDAVYAVSPARVRAKFGLAGLLFAYGVVANYLWWFVGPARPDHLALIILCGPPLWGISILRHIRRARGLHILAYPNGLLRVQDSQVESYPWDEIAELALRTESGEVVCERDDDGNMTGCRIAVEAPLMKFWDAGLTLHRRDGRSATFTPAVTDYPDLVERCQRGTFAAMWPSLQARFRAGVPVTFGGFLADTTGLYFGTKSMPWGEIAGVEVSAKRLSVKRTGKWSTWASQELAEVPNPHLLLALIEDAKRGSDSDDSDETNGETA